MGKNNKVYEKDRNGPNSHRQQVLVNAKDEHREGRKDIFHDEEVDVPIANEKVHEGVDLLGSVLDMEDRKPCIQDRKQNNEEERYEETVAIAVHI